MQLTNIWRFHCFLFALSDKYLGSQKLKQFKPQECKLVNWKSHVFLNIQLSLLLFSEIVQPRLFIHPPLVINKQTMHGKHGGHVPSTSDLFLNAERDKQTPGAAISTHADARLVHGVKGMRSTFDFLSLLSLFAFLLINWGRLTITHFTSVLIHST